MGIEFKNKILAVLVFLFGLAAFFFTLKWTTGFSNLYTNNTVGLAIFWVGYFALVASVLLLKPIMMMSSDDKINIGMIGAGAAIFIVSTFAFYIGGQILDGILGISGFESIQDSTYINQIVSFGYLIVGVLSMNVFPIYYIMVKA